MFILEKGPIYGWASNRQTTFASKILYLDMFEYVNVWVRTGKTSGYSDVNYFQIQKID